MSHPHYKLAVESITRCGGGCSGCVLSMADRGAIGAHIDQRLPSALLDLASAMAARTSGPQERITHFLPGNHLLLSEAEIPEFVERVHALSQGGYAALSVSAVMNAKPLRVALQAYQAARKASGQKIAATLVLDEQMLSSSDHQAAYLDNILAIRQAFDYFEVVFNLGPASIGRGMTPERLDGMLTQLEMSHCDINLTPPRHRSAAFRLSWADMMRWLQQYGRLRANRGDLNFASALKSLAPEVMDLSATDLTRWLRQRLPNEIYAVPATGMLYFMQAGFLGNLVPLGERSGFEPALPMVHTVAELEAASVRMAVRLTGEFTRAAVCAACQHRNTCVAGGVSQVLHVFNGFPSGKTECPAGVRDFLDFLSTLPQDPGHALP